MKIAVMQPYLFPYMGYFQLISAVDTFVIFDDANFIKRGWINRNRILLDNKDHLFTLPLEKASQNKFISQIRIACGQKHKEKILDLFHHAYRKAPEYANVYPLIKEIILNRKGNLLEFIEYSLVRIAAFLDLKTNFMLSSEIEKDNTLKGKDKIIDICKKMRADKYLNPIGGKELYDKKEFEKEGIKLHFLKTKDIEYRQFTNIFIPHLSIIDVLMFNPRKKVKEFLSEYEAV